MGLRGELGKHTGSCLTAHSQTMCAKRPSTLLTQLLNAYLDGQLRVGCACDAEFRELRLEEVPLAR